MKSGLSDMSLSSVSKKTTSFSISLADVRATEELGKSLSRLLEIKDVVTLSGELGAGKTTLARAIISELGHIHEVPSPTFTLVQYYHLQAVSIWHFDLYRLNSPEELLELDLDEARYSAISLIEWPDRMGDFTPEERLEIKLSFDQDEQKRHAIITGYGNWATRIREVQSAL